MTKKIIFFVLMVLFLVGIVACQSTTDSINTSTSTSNPNTSSTTVSSSVSTTTSTITSLTPSTVDTSITTTPSNLEISFSQSQVVLLVQTTKDIPVVFTNLRPTEEALIQYGSSNEAIASISKEGKITAHQVGLVQVTVYFSEAIQATIDVIVSRGHTVIPPNKTQYLVGEALDVTGALLQIRNHLGTIINRITITEDMIVAFDSDALGSQRVEFCVQDDCFGFDILVVNTKQLSSMLADIVLDSSELVVGKKIEFFATHLTYDAMRVQVSNVYDYQEIHLYAQIKTPSLQEVRVSSFWFQQYIENLQSIMMNPTRNLEGTVNDKLNDYDVKVLLLADGRPEFRFRYLPKESGMYQATFYLEVDGVIIQTMTKLFEVSESMDESFQGFLQVNPNATRHFSFESGKSFHPVGQNVAWYTSKDRLHYDYKYWFNQMGQAEMNYARVWLAAWGFSPFWDDIMKFDTRLTNLYSLDQTLNFADEEGIYIQLCLLHHGMFSKEVNPMWPNSSNTWYTSKYGVNPYSKYFDNPGLFFTSDFAKDNFKNQLRYLIARYGYSDHIMSFELFNEVDWIESYSAVSGTAWHDEMAQFIRSIDPNQHMITTSTKGDSFLSSTYSVFRLDSIDYVNVHNYGIFNHVQTLPPKQNTGYLAFQKPIMYSEIGYSGNSGTDQFAKDPKHITLSQALWGGLMGGGGGSGMNWWWESWIDKYDAYSTYLPVARFANQMNLVGESYAMLQSSTSSLANVSLSASLCGYLGYKVDQRVYLYIYDVSYTLLNDSVGLKSGVTLSIPSLPFGDYVFKAYSTANGTLLLNQQITYQQGSLLMVTLPNFYQDIAISIEKVNY